MKLQESYWTCLRAWAVDTSFSTLNYQYRKLSEGPEVKPDITALLEFEASKSIRFNAPEDSPDLWEIMRSKMSEEQLRILNSWRTRLGRNGSLS